MGHETSLAQEELEQYRKAPVPHGETWTFHSGVLFSPMQLMFYLVQGVNYRSWIGS